MQTKPQFHPVARLELPGCDPVPASGLILLVGPNSCGKTLLLKDILYRVIGEIRRFVVATNIALAVPATVDELLRSLPEDSTLRDAGGEGSDKRITLLSTAFGIGGAPGGTFLKRDADEWLKVFQEETFPDGGVKHQSSISHLKLFGPPLVLK